MLNEATMAADAKRKELMDQVRRDVDAVKARWQDMLVREQDAFFYDLRQRAAKQLYATARKALADLADVELEDRIVDEFIRRVKELDEEKVFRFERRSAAVATRSSSRAPSVLPNQNRHKSKKR